MTLSAPDNRLTIAVFPNEFSAGAKLSKRALFRQERVAIVLLALFAAAHLYWPLWQAFMPLERSPNEAWNAWHTDAILQGRSLYPDQSALIVNNYPPLSFYLVGMISAFTPDAIYAGRLVSLLSFGLAAALIGFCVRSLGGSRTAAVFGALWFIATMSVFFNRYIAINDPNMLALAAMGGALALFLSRLQAGKSVEPALACMVLAGFVKHSLIAIPISALVWLAWQRPRSAFRASLFSAGLVGLGLAICLAAYGTGFLDQLLMPRVLHLARALRAANKIQWVAPALLFWGLWVWTNRDRNAARFSALLVGISYASCSLQSAGEGVVRNAFFELVFASSIAVALAFAQIAAIPLAKRLGVAQSQRAVIAILVLRLLLAQRAEPYLALYSQAFQQEVGGKLLIMEWEVERIKAIPGPVVCSTMTVCYRAGKPFLYDPFWAGQKLETGKLSREQVDNAITSAGIRFEEINPELLLKKNRLF